MLKNFSNQKILDKLLPKRGNKRKKNRNLKNIIIVKIGVKVIYLILKILLTVIKLTNYIKTFTKYLIGFYISSKNDILS